MQMEEVLSSPFNTATTCYSTRTGGTRNLPFRFATENHVLGLSLESDDSTIRTVTHGAVPRDNTSVICVGFAQYPHPDEQMTEPIQALAIVDPLCTEQPEEAPPTLYQPLHTSTADGKDDISVASNALSIQDSASSRGNLRPSLTNNSSSITVTSITSSTLTRSKSDTSSAMDNNTASNPHEDRPTDTTSFGTQHPKARLVLHVPAASHEDSSIFQDHVALLEFRPLCPCIAQWGSQLGVFVGSADDSQLRFYEPSHSDPRRLVARGDLPEAHFHIDTPVLGIDFHSDGAMHTLGVVGQDGTIQLISWTGNEKTFSNLFSHRVIVDGPLVSLHLQGMADGGLRIVVGSLCGYVCQLIRPRSSSSWEAPTMIAQGLWNDTIQSEDSILAVHTFEDCIVLGTLSGRCLMFRAAMYGDKYFKIWECTLPYSVHGFGVETTTTSRLALIVLTRRSVHVFRDMSSGVSIPSLPERTFSVNRMKDRLRALLRTPDPVLESELPPLDMELLDQSDESTSPSGMHEDSTPVDQQQKREIAGEYIDNSSITATYITPSDPSSNHEIDENEFPAHSEEQRVPPDPEEDSTKILPQEYVSTESKIPLEDEQDEGNDEAWVLIDQTDSHASSSKTDDEAEKTGETSLV